MKRNLKLLITLFLITIGFAPLWATESFEDCRKELRDMYETNPKTSKDFNPILDGYEFFREHSTEAEQGLKVFSDVLSSIAPRLNQPVSILDFGGGDGEFTMELLRRSFQNFSNIKLSLMDPSSKSLELAQRRFADSGLSEFKVSESLEGLEAKYDLIISNHVLYYVSELSESLTKLFSKVNSGGMLLVMVASEVNDLIRFWKKAYPLLGGEVPHHTYQNIYSSLSSLSSKAVREHSLKAELRFNDSVEGRRAMARFLVGNEYHQFSESELLSLFDAYKQGKEIVMRIDDRLILIEK